MSASAARYNPETARRKTRSVKWDLLRQPPATPFTVADMDLPSPDGLADALHRALRQPALGYTFEDPRVRMAIADWYGDVHGTQLAPDEVVTVAVSPKVMLRVLLRALGCRGRVVVIEPPVYGGFANAVAAVGAEYLTVPLLLRDRCYRHDFPAFEAALRRYAPAAVVLCSPQNPMGRVWHRAELVRMLELCDRYGVAVVSDEVHGDLVLDEDRRHHPAVGLAAGSPVVVLSSPGKTFNVSAIPASVVMSRNPDVMAAVRAELARCGLHPGSLLTDAMMVHLFGTQHRWRLDLLGRLRRNRAVLLRQLATVPGLVVIRPAAGFLAWVDARGVAGAEPAPEVWFTRHGVQVVGGDEFGTGGRGFVRWNYATTEAFLTDAAVRLRAAAMPVMAAPA